MHQRKIKTLLQYKIDQIMHGHIRPKLLLYIGFLDLNGHLLSVLQGCPMDLGDRG